MIPGPVKIATIQKIAKKKGLVFEYDEPSQSYVMRDKITSMCLAEYANITISLITSDRVWREECNKLRASAFR